MRKRKIIYGILLGLVVLSLVLAGIIFYSRSQELKIIFLDVGQGDAILIEQGSKQILIDGGPSGQALLNAVGKYVPFWDREIELVIATHPDADHITGLVDLIKSYQVDAIMQTAAQSDSQVFKKMQETIQQKNVQVVQEARGEKINLPDGVQLEILNPGPETPVDPQDTNADSIVAKLSYGHNYFLLTGDLPSEQEAALINLESDLSAQVLKVAHHGSKYATGADFLAKVNPQEAVISVGNNNRYGHPNSETLDRLKGRNIKIWRTDEMGDIFYSCPDPNAQCQLVAN